MKWSTVKLIFSREMRDQFRDRRTLFTVAVMPLILYPLMGMAMLQVAQFMREHPTDIWVIGGENLPSSPPLIEDGKISREWVSEKNQKLLRLQGSNADDAQFFLLIKEFKESPDATPGAPGSPGSQLVDRLLEQQMKERKVDLAIVIPASIEDPGEMDFDGPEVTPSKVYVFHNSAEDKSKIAADRLGEILGRWQRSYVEHTLGENNVPPWLVQRIEINGADVADNRGRSAAMWSKILPFVVMVWSLTGAFYPAIDLCAGEKERGTFETLLSSPAKRSEIAIGKLLTVISFSMATALLNMLSMAFTGLFVYSRMTAGIGGMQMGAPPMASLLWLVVALVPISALFSAVALAAAAFARSSKEGQYYLVPLMMFSMPLMIIPMLPAAKLDFGTSLIPVTGLMLLLRSLIEGHYAQALQFFAPVCCVTIVCCWVAVRWVVHQFNSETVLFRASERFAIGAWMKSVFNQRHDIPSIGNALLCCVTILVLKFFIGIAAAGVVPTSFVELAQITLAVLLAGVLFPTLIMAMMLTTNAWKTLKLSRCSIPVACAAAIMAICFHPALMALTSLVMAIYPPIGDTSQIGGMFESIMGSAPGFWAILLVMAVVPAIVEELSFRGFILSGLERLRNKWQAILLASLFFGMAHSFIQQSIVTGFVGLILGVVAVQTRSIIPCMIYHVTHNSLTLILSMISPARIESSPLLRNVVHSPDGNGFEYTTFATVAMAVIAVGILAWFLKLNIAEPEAPPAAIDDSSPEEANLATAESAV